VMFFEHKKTYRLFKAEVPDGDTVVPIGKAVVARPGKHLSIFCYGFMRTCALEAAETLAREDGIEAEVVDLRTLRPLDVDAVSLMSLYRPPWPLHGVEVCCGTGRYLRRLASSQSRGAVTVGIDLNESMLSTASSQQDPSGAVVRLVRADCCHLPFGNASLGWVAIFDAIHLVDIHRVVEEMARVLASGGFLLIYTRTPEQNARSLLGRLFPQFSEKEGRLHSEHALRCAIEKGGFRIEALVPLHHERSASREDVLAEVRQRPYSTFVFYTAAEWSSAIEKFAANLEHSGSDIMSWSDENLLLACRRTGAAW